MSTMSLAPNYIPFNSQHDSGCAELSGEIGLESCPCALPQTHKSSVINGHFHDCNEKVNLMYHDRLSNAALRYYLVYGVDNVQVESENCGL